MYKLPVKLNVNAYYKQFTLYRKEVGNMVNKSNNIL